MSYIEGLYALREDIETSVRFEPSGHRTYVLKNPETGGSLEFGEEEYYVCTLLTGKYTIPIIQAAFLRRFNMTISIEQINALIERLRQAGFISEDRLATFTALFETTIPDTWTRFRFFETDHIFRRLATVFSWCFTAKFVAASVATFCLALLVVYNNYVTLGKEVQELFHTVPFYFIILTGYLFINIPGELARGISYVHFGARVEGFGIWFAYDVIPKFYCLGTVWDISSKAGRGWVYFSTCYYSLLAMSASVVLWAVTPPDTALHTFFLMVAVVGFIDGFIRSNFLWPTDAQFVFDNWMEIPAFRARAVSTAIAWLFRKPMPEMLSDEDKRLFIGYGLAALAATLAGGFAVLYLFAPMLIESAGGWGALLVLFAGFFKYRKWLFHYLKHHNMVRSVMKNNSNIKKKGKSRKWMYIAIVLLGMLIPYPYEPGGPFKFSSFRQIEVNTQVAGEIKEVLVREGDWVKAGQVLAVLDDREHRKNYEVTKANLESAEAQLRLLKAGPKPEEVEKARVQLETAKTKYEFSRREAERLKDMYEGGAVSEEEYESAKKAAAVDAKNVELAAANLALVKSGARPEEIEAQEALVRDLATRLAFYKDNLERCVIRSPASGQVVTPDLDKMVGKILKENDHLLTLQDSTIIRAEIYMPEADMNDDRIGARVKVRPWAYPTRLFYGKVIAVSPRAEDSAQGKVVRVLTEIPNEDQMLKPDMTGEAKVYDGWTPVIVAFSHSIVRFVMVEVWSWLP